MLRNQLVVLCLMAGLLGACGSSPSTTVTTQTTNRTASTSQQAAKPNSAPLPVGDYPVQQVSYDDSNGQYNLMLLNLPQGASPVFRTDALQMARISDEDVKAGKASYFQVQGDRQVLHLTPEFQIQYVPTVAENRVDPNTGETKVVYVRQQPTFWSPFLTGAAVGAVASNLLTPRYYVPPAYVVGQPLVGYGGYGNTYDRAVSSYQSRYNEPPRSSRNRTTFRTTGNITRPQTTNRSTTTSTTPPSTTTRTSPRPNSFGSSPRTSPASTTKTTGSKTTNTNSSTGSSAGASPSTAPATTTRQKPKNTNRSTGSGFGSSTLRNSGGTSTSKPRRRSSFGSSGGRRSRSGSRRRRR